MNSRDEEAIAHDCRTCTLRHEWSAASRFFTHDRLANCPVPGNTMIEGAIALDAIVIGPDASPGWLTTNQARPSPSTARRKATPWQRVACTLVARCGRLGNAG
jgi:hypothetical protein